MSDPRTRMAEQLSAFAGEPYQDFGTDPEAELMRRHMERNGTDPYRAEPGASNAGRAFGAGMIDPFGLTSAIASSIPTNMTQNAAARMQEARGSHPDLAHSGSWSTLGALFGGGIANGIGLGGRALMTGYGGAAGSATGGAMAGQRPPWTNMRYPNRAQARYPRDGY